VQICQVYDAAELCRNVHVDATWRHAATNACSTVGGTPLPSSLLPPPTPLSPSLCQLPLSVFLWGLFERACIIGRGHGVVDARDNSPPGEGRAVE
jgi:hypothetical protein